MNKLLILLLLSGCAPEIIYKPVPVEVPTPVPCHIIPIEKPAFYTSNARIDDDLFSQTKALVVTNEQRKAYEIQLEAAIKACQ